ncbi:MAG: DNA primase [Anaerovoracaceae bacterium]|jgi:DNA primase
MTFNRIIEEIKSRCNIIDVVGRYVVLKKAGNNHKGLCPFHNEKTPSFMVSEDKQIFTCFGCGATGDVIEFVQRMDNINFREAIEKLAEEYGIETETISFSGNDKKKAFHDINRRAASYFYSKLRQPGSEGYEYMIGRGIGPDILRKFGIGYADNNWDGLYNHLMSEGIPREDLLTLGLISNSKGKYYDRFRGRIIFPIINTRGLVIGFGGRAIGDGVPKYLNSPESPVFMKKNNLYGLNLTRQDINREDYAILVEGYMDVISLYSHGIRNVAASLGTALTESQAEMLKRYTENVVLAYDGDSAGQAAALRGMDVLNRVGCKVRVLTMEDGDAKDPDDYIKSFGREAFRRLVKEAKPAIRFRLDLLKMQENMGTAEGSVAFLKKAAGVLRDLSPVEADVYIKGVSAETGISEGAIRMEVYGGMFGGDPGPISTADNRITKTREKEGKTEKANSLDDGHILLERTLIRLMLIKGSYIKDLEPYEDVFSSREGQEIYGLIKSLYKEDEEIDIRQLKDGLEERDRQILEIIEESIHLSHRDETVFGDCINRIKEAKDKKREEEIIILLSILEDENDKGAIEELTKELIRIQEGKESRRSNP